MLELERQYQFYLEHEAEFLEKYEGKYLVISEDLDVTSFDTKQEAYAFGAENFGLGNFLLQECTYDATHTVNYMNFNAKMKTIKYKSREEAMAAIKRAVEKKRAWEQQALVDYAESQL